MILLLSFFLFGISNKKLQIHATSIEDFEAIVFHHKEGKKRTWSVYLKPTPQTQTTSGISNGNEAEQDFDYTTYILCKILLNVKQNRKKETQVPKAQ